MTSQATFVAHMFGPRRRRRLLGRHSPLIDIAQFAALSALLLWLTLRGAESLRYNWQWYRVRRYLYRIVDGELIWGLLAQGLLVTLEIAVWSMALTLALGVVTALLRMTLSFSAQLLARSYLELIRNTPLLVQLYLLYFVIAPILGIDRFWTGVLCLGLHEGAFASEIIRAGILSVHKGQWEAADGIGLSTADKYRFVVFPQAVPLMLPPLTGVAVNLIKHSAIVSVIAVFDLTTQGRNIIADTFMSFEIWFTVAAMYLAITIALSACVSYLEYRMRKG